MEFDESFLKRFWEKVDKKGEDECWEWAGYIHKPTRYGYVSYLGKTYRTHRVAYELANGKFSEDLCVCHTCDNRSCCNPKHLWLGTRKDNILDMKNKNRQFKPKGELNIKSKITKNDVLEIRKLYFEENFTQIKLAEIYGLCKSQIYRIINNKNWEDQEISEIPRHTRNMAKLKLGEVLLIKKLLNQNSLSAAKIGKIFKVTKSTIESIKYRRSWRHIE